MTDIAYCKSRQLSTSRLCESDSLRGILPQTRSAVIRNARSFGGDAFRGGLNGIRLPNPRYFSSAAPLCSIISIILPLVISRVNTLYAYEAMNIHKSVKGTAK
jgi:hypothetical protein